MYFILSGVFHLQKDTTKNASILMTDDQKRVGAKTVKTVQNVSHIQLKTNLNIATGDIIILHVHLTDSERKYGKLNTVVAQKTPKH